VIRCRKYSTRSSETEKEEKKCCLRETKGLCSGWFGPYDGNEGKKKSVGERSGKKKRVQMQNRRTPLVVDRGFDVESYP